jgi:hypothetical protein
MRTVIAMIVTCTFHVSILTIPILKVQPNRLEYKIEGAGISINLPNDNWSLANKPEAKGTINYIFKRNAIVDSHGFKIVPAIMVQYSTVQYKGNATQYMLDNIGEFAKKGLDIQKVFNSDDEGYPLTYKNASLIKGFYNQNGIIHTIYLIYIINKKGFVVQVNMDMTNDISVKCNSEFLAAMRSIKEIK